MKKPQAFLTRLIAMVALFALALSGLAAGFTPAMGAAPTAPSVSNVPNGGGTEALPAGATIETLLPNMVNPIAMAFDPAGRLFYTEKTTGNVRLYENGTLQNNPVITFSVISSGEQGLLGIAIDPDFNTNRYIYVFYTCNCTPRENRVVRFQENAGVGTNPVTVFTSPNDTGASNHNGGNIHFGQDGKLYISLGDDGCCPQYSQNVTVKQGKMHRINGDGTIPTDNPVFTQTGALPSLFAMGLRNSFDFDVDPYTTPNPWPRIFASENGPGCDDEMNRVEGGYNYGWRSGYPCDDPNPSPTYNTIAPLWYLNDAECCEAPTGLEVYRGNQIPQWTGHIFMATYNNSAMRHMYPSGDRQTLTAVNIIQGVSVGTDIESGPDGALWYIQGGGYSPGTLKRIVCSTCGGSTPTATTVPPTSTVVPPSSTPVPPTNTATRTNTAMPPSSTPVPPSNTPVGPTATRTNTPTGTVVPPSSTPIVPTSTRTSTAQATNTSVGATSTGTSVVQPTETLAPTQTATATATVCTIEFTDVPSDNEFNPFVRCLACRGIVSGYQCGGPGEPCDANNNPYFRPNSSITRGQIAKVVANAAGLTEDSGEPIYADVPSGHPFYSWINRLTLRGYMGGYDCGGPLEPCNGENQPYFRPYNNATRGQLSKIVSNAANYVEIPTSQTFEDVPNTHPFYVWIERLASRGIMGGYPCGGPFEPCGGGNLPYFRPGSEVTRGQASKIVANTFRGSCPLPPAGTSNVDIELYIYQPMDVTVSVGDTVRWFNYDLDYHTATSITNGVPDGRFDSGNVNQYESWGFTFTEPGTYNYFCTPHPYMVGTITVTAP